MKRSVVFMATLAAASLFSACGGDTATNSNVSGTATTNTAATTVNRNGLIETNVNANINPNTVSSNTAVVINNNGSTGTAGISTLNSNAAARGNTNGAGQNTNARP